MVGGAGVGVGLGVGWGLRVWLGYALGPAVAGDVGLAAGVGVGTFGEVTDGGEVSGVGMAAVISGTADAAGRLWSVA